MSFFRCCSSEKALEYTEKSPIKPKLTEREVKERSTTTVALDIFTLITAAAKELESHVPLVIYTLISDYAEILKPAQILLNSSFNTTLPTYNLLAQVCSKIPQYALSKQLLAEMESKEIKPDLETFNSIIEANAIESGGGDNYHYLRIMIKRGIQPDINTFNNYFNGCLIYSNENPRGAMNMNNMYLSEICAAPLPFTGESPVNKYPLYDSLNAITCSIQINLHIKCSSQLDTEYCAEQALRFFGIMRLNKFDLDDSTSSRLIDLCDKVNMHDKATEVLEYTSKKGKL